MRVTISFQEIMFCNVFCYSLLHFIINVSNMILLYLLKNTVLYFSGIAIDKYIGNEVSTYNLLILLNNYKPLSSVIAHVKLLFVFA